MCHVLLRVVSRADDTEDAVRVRLSSYERTLAAIKRQYGSLVKMITGVGEKTAVFSRITTALDHMARRR
jgi:adenylate kinase family enzyme